MLFLLLDFREVQVVSSHTYVVDQPGTLGVRQGMSQLVANMLESVQHLWKLHTPPEHVSITITDYFYIIRYTTQIKFNLNKIVFFVSDVKISV
jgi:hypothetical protein